MSHTPVLVSCVPLVTPAIQVASALASARRLISAFATYVPSCLVTFTPLAVCSTTGSGVGVTSGVGVASGVGVGIGVGVACITVTLAPAPSSNPHPGMQSAAPRSKTAKPAFFII